jgi:hypothetical protein
MTKIIITIFTILISNTAFSEKVSDRELNTFLEAIKEKKDEELLIASPQFDDCKELLGQFKNETDGGETGNKYKKQLGDCVKDKILGKDGVEGADKKLLEIASKLELESYNKGASSSASSIRDYLSKRLYKAIHGVDRDSKKLADFKDRKIVNHDVYYQLYEEQIGKNTLLEVSKYCLENFGLKNDKDDFLYIVTKKGQDDSGKETSISTYKKHSLITQSTGFNNALIEVKNLKSTATAKSVDYSKRFEINKDAVDTVLTEIKAGVVPTNSISNLWKEQGDKIEEYQACTAKTEKECDKIFKIDGTTKITPYRSIFTNELLKNIEFKLAANDPEKELIKARYGFCATSVVQNMCEIYKCNNSYDVSNEKIVTNCSEKFGITVSRTQKLFSTNENNPNAAKVDSIELKSDSQKGAIACNLMRRLQEYRVVLKTVNEIQKDNKNHMAVTGINNEEGNTVFTGGKGAIDKLTSISSVELVENVDSLKNAEKNAATLRETCLEPNDGGNELDGFKFKEGATELEACAPLVAKMDSAKFETIKLDTEAKTALKLKQIEDLTDKEQLEEYLRENNLDHYIGKIKDMEIDEIKNLVSADFKSKRMALVDSLKERFRKESQMQVGSQEADAQETFKGLQNDVANQTIADIEQHKKRVETLFEYSNIVSSYLGIEDSDGNIVGSNVVGRNVEFEKNENVKNDYFNDQESSGGSGGSLDYLQALELIVGIPKDDEKDK